MKIQNIDIDKTMDECRVLCNHIKKLSKINNPDLWKKYGEPHITLWTSPINKKFDFFRVEWSNDYSESTTVFFTSNDAKMNIDEFRKNVNDHKILMKKVMKNYKKKFAR